MLHHLLKWIHNLDRIERLTIVQVFAEEYLAMQFLRCRDICVKTKLQKLLLDFQYSAWDKRASLTTALDQHPETAYDSVSPFTV